ncbi:hypothetical protein U1Q18_033085 [Sarracenia purpurea var. burkii]
MSVIDIRFRVEAICKKYDKYDVEKQRELNASTDDAFARLYSDVESQIDAALRVQGLSREQLATRHDLVLALPDRIQSIPDGTTSAVKQTGGWAASASHKKIKFDSDGRFDGNFFHQTEETSQFREEYEMRKMKQDQGLDIISEGLDTLKNLAHDMNEELDRQVPLIDEIDTKVDGAAADLKNTNVRLKDNLNKIRSSRNFFIDIILLCVILGIASYLYKYVLNIALYLA